MPDFDADFTPLRGVLQGSLADHSESANSRTALRQQRRKATRRRRSRGRRLIVLLVTLSLVGGASFGAYTVLSPVVKRLTASNDFEGSGSGSVTVTVVEGSSGRSIGQVLEQAGVVKSSKAFVEAAAANPKSGSIQPGQYTLRRQMSAESALTLLLSPGSRAIKKVTIREGLRASEVVAELAKATGNPVAEYLAVLKKPAGLGLPAAAQGNAEGWLFPDTYSFDLDSTPEAQLAAMVAGTQKVLTSLNVDPAQAQRLIIVASIAEVEASSPGDYAKVARVVQNRLDNKLGTGGKLQLDSTVSYAVGRRSLTTTPAERAVNSRYNTYRYPGLPIGPISNPGKAAIVGAMDPTPGPWLFFVTIDPSTGETNFSVTADEHIANVRKFRAWCQAHPGKC